MTLYYTTDFADRLVNEIIPALRAGFVVLTDRYIFSIMARAIARGEDRAWIEKVTGFALVPHKVFYLRASVKDLVSRVVLGRGRFDYWESGMDLHFGRNMFESFVKYQTRLIHVFDRLARTYDIQMIDASRPPDDALRQSIDPCVSVTLWLPLNFICRPGGLMLPQYNFQRGDVRGSDAFIQRSSQNPCKMLNGRVQPCEFRFVVEHLLFIVLHDFIQMVIHIHNINKITMLV
jgi:thymidylate kinase